VKILYFSEVLLFVVLLSVILQCHFAECYFVECHFTVCTLAKEHFAQSCLAECYLAECHFAECHFVECHFAWLICGCHYDTRWCSMIPIKRYFPLKLFLKIKILDFKLQTKDLSLFYNTKNIKCFLMCLDDPVHKLWFYVIVPFWHCIIISSYPIISCQNVQWKYLIYANAWINFLLWFNIAIYH
jgi:hypothetical protein